MHRARKGTADERRSEEMNADNLIRVEAARDSSSAFICVHLWFLFFLSFLLGEPLWLCASVVQGRTLDRNQVINRWRLLVCDRIITCASPRRVLGV